MENFDDLPPSNRALILSTLELQIVLANCRTIFELARKRNQSIDEVWRDICKKTGQRCAMPPAVAYAQYSSTSSETAAALLESTTPASPTAEVRSAASTNAVGCPSSASVSRNHRSSKRPLMVAAALGAIVLGIGLSLVVLLPRSTPHASLTASTTRPDETIRTGATARAGSDKQAGDPASVPAPQGTVRRIDAINKSFSKR